MALNPCPECRRDTSTQASACPHCGYPLSRLYDERTTALSLDDFDEIVDQVSERQTDKSPHAVDDSTTSGAAPVRDRKVPGWVFLLSLLIFPAVVFVIALIVSAVKESVTVADVATSVGGATVLGCWIAIGLWTVERFNEANPENTRYLNDDHASWMSFAGGFAVVVLGVVLGSGWVGALISPVGAWLGALIYCNWAQA